MLVCAGLYWRQHISLLLLLLWPWLAMLLALAGVGAGSTDLRTMQLSGVAGLVAGALSMACGAWLAAAQCLMTAHTAHSRPTQVKG
jgi:hypothetical protein